MTKERKYILIGGAILLLIGAIYRFGPADFDGFHPLGEEISLKERKLVKYRQMVQERNELDGKLIALNRSLERAETGLLTGETPSLAAVDIQNILNEIGSRSEVEITSMRVLAPKNHLARDKGVTEESPAGQYTGIPVQISIVSTIRQLKELLYGIETSSKFLRVTEMKVRARDRQVKKIYSTFTVEGFMKKREDNS
ncbi:type II secretion system protein GspM [Desulfococcaceae bacterium HSG8]|nr:type II secretion system protein GspM [Desulfococcaceae bacterium HSG8]